jgi:hypothetical protein
MGDANKVNKVGRTSWDSFSYAILMGHNVWSHLDAVQQANRAYDNGILPNMLVDEKFKHVYVRDVIDSIFAVDNLVDALAIIKTYNKLWIAIPGTRGNTGKKTINPDTKVNELWSFDDDDDDFVDEELNLSNLEDSIKDE